MLGIPLTVTQHHLREQQSTSNLVVCFDIQGSVAPDKFVAAFATTVEETPILRTTIQQIDGEFKQIVQETCTTPCEAISVENSADPVAEFERFRQQRSSRAFDEATQLFESVLVRLSSTRSIWYLCLSRLIADSQSISLLYQNTLAYYNQKDVIQHDDNLMARYVEHEQKSMQPELIAESKNFWAHRRSEGLPKLMLYGMDANCEAERAHRLSIDLDNARSQQLRAIAHRFHTTPYEVLLSVWFAYLYRVSGNEIISVQASMARPALDWLRTEVGPYSTACPVQVNLDEDDSFSTLLHKTMREVDVVSENLQGLYPVAADACIPRVKYDYYTLQIPSCDSAQSRVDIPSLSRQADGLSTQGGTAIAMQVLDFGSEHPLQIHLDVNEQIFSIEFSTRMQIHFSRMLEGLVASQDTRVNAISMLDESENRSLFRQFDTRERTDNQQQLFMERFRYWTESTPDSVAVDDFDECLTYAELYARARILATHLRNTGAKLGDRILVSLARNSDLVSAMIAIFEAGCVYVPVDPLNPRSRIDAIIKNADAAVIIVHKETKEVVPEGHSTLIVLDDMWLQVTANEPYGKIETTHSNISSLIYTSGSTGTPKGVAMLHTGLANQLESMRELFRFDQKDRMLAVTTAAFDASMLELCLPLWCGGSVEVVDDVSRRDPVALIERMKQTSVTAMFATPATWQMLVGKGWSGCRSLKVISGGEALSRDLADELLKRADEVWNIYGPTETTICSTVEMVKDDGQPVSIGKPIKNTVLRILNTEQQPVPQGVQGELYIGGAGVTEGYFGQPELTSERFISDPFEPGQRLYKTGDIVRHQPTGALQYIGRTDSQVKLRGYRIETGEIESALREHEGVADAVVIMRGDSLAERYLEAYIVPHLQLNASSILEHLRSRVPPYMLPSRLTQIEHFPINANGKVDRKAFAQRPLYDTKESIKLPSSDLEVQLSLIWRDLCGRELSCEGNFFELAGNSLLAVQLLTKIEDQLGVQVPFGYFYENPTITGLATYVDDHNTGSFTNGAVLLNAYSGNERPIFCIDGVHLYQALAKALETNVPVYGVYIQEEQTLLANNRRQRIPAVLEPAESIAQRYIDAIRAQQPTGPYRLAGFSYGGIIAYEIAQQLISSGDGVESLVLLDTPLIRSISRSQGVVAFAQHVFRIFKQKGLVRCSQGKSVDLQRIIAVDRYEREVLQNYPASALLCRALGESVIRKETEKSLGWRNFIENLIVKDCPGDHLGMLSEDNSQKLAESISAFLFPVSTEEPTRNQDRVPIQNLGLRHTTLANVNPSTSNE